MSELAEAEGWMAEWRGIGERRLDQLDGDLFSLKEPQDSP